MLTRTLIALCKRDYYQVWRSPADLVKPWLFFLCVILLFPLAITSDQTLLKQMAPGIVWIAASLASLLAIDRLFQTDYQDGSLNHLLLSAQPLALLVSVRVIMHWLLANLPLLIITPFVGLLFGLPLYEISILWFSLLLGTPIICMLGAIAAALTMTVAHNSMLLVLLIVPLMIPVVIFGVGSVAMVAAGVSPLSLLALLAAMMIVSVMFAPFAIAAALKIGS